MIPIRIDISCNPEVHVSCINTFAFLIPALLIRLMSEETLDVFLCCSLDENCSSVLLCASERKREKSVESMYGLCV